MIQTFDLLPGFHELMTLAEKQADAYQKNHPYPHIVLEELFSPDLLDQILGEFPSDKEWRRVQEDYQEKFSTVGENTWGPQTKLFMHYLNSEPFLKFLEKLTGISGLIPDPYFYGGGFHQSLKGGFLKIHTDFNRHSLMKLDRRVNLLIYLNKDWPDEYGGHLELWDREVKKCGQKILPVFNRVVVFSTTDFSYHGHPKPLACPEDRTRKSIALYYYTNGRPPEETKSQARNTSFKLTPDENFKTRLKSAIKLILPPLVVEAYKRFKA